MFFPYKDDNPRILVPVVTYGIIAANMLIFLYQFSLSMSGSEAEAGFIYMFGLIPAQFNIINLFTSMFLHGGIAHILGNMWFLWIFGDNVESALGHTRYALFYILCGLAAGLAQVIFNIDSTIPMVGASGAIAGVLGAYLLRYPHAQVHVFVFIFIFFTTIRVPAIIVLGIWFLTQLTNGLATMGINTTGGVAWFAHIGGFVAGLGFNYVFQQIKFKEY
ncbi:MAG: rhomboid family intramembrane serine protease [Candidatus Marinimicrobia bacterium]|jgi:membrane associated rhomboid family serine protease|nr:rhomboid family intramembrane serine protease [Candidatus Neomarinimicrobiota bacterium]MDP6275699.1 rhomboid family intramembrane serine protease [Candidatus Neomarinimicrobiota bacterium]MDP7331069.1 rhomboid family intramembrane serine protease [Candidatus Neomarinimicrobiota bacterium]HJL74480.1 rhomboid family intramembrane serine protease [Candidatus Neomarinimicrobiota bacterium]|tara:strand:+ start:585 stop:1241 length:657 start_codon:yes stop_codon:yes gene_type:complete